MPVEQPDPSPEREQTDESLREERDKSDLALAAGRDAVIEGAVLWEDNSVEEGASLRGSVVGRGNRIGAKAHLADGTVVGDNCAIGAENRLDHGMRLWPGVALPDHAISF